jgi:hypothetical protein
LTPPQRLALTDALAGLYKMAGVALVREQLEACFGNAVARFTINAQGIVVRARADSTAAAVYHLEAGPLIPPSAFAGSVREGLPTVAADQVLFGRMPLAWETWVETWEQDQAGRNAREPVIHEYRLLPSIASAPA